MVLTILTMADFVCGLQEEAKAAELRAQAAVRERVENARREIRRLKVMAEEQTARLRSSKPYPRPPLPEEQ